MAQKGKGPYNGGELPLKSVPVYQDELHLLSVYNKETCTRTIIKKYLCYKGESKEAKLLVFRETIPLQRKESRFQLCTQNDCLRLVA